MGYKKIDNYGIIGNGQTLALVGIDGAIDWMCLPYMDSPSVFAAILDDEKGGRFRVRPLEAWDSVQRYLPRTNILKTSFRTAGGEFELIDFMPIGPLTEKDPATRTMVNRCLKGKSGRVRIEIDEDIICQPGHAVIFGTAKINSLITAAPIRPCRIYAAIIVRGYLGILRIRASRLIRIKPYVLGDDY